MCWSAVHLQVRTVISSFGALKAFSLLRDASGTPTGTALAEFADPGVINPAIAGGRVWVVSMSSPHAAEPVVRHLWDACQSS